MDTDQTYERNTDIVIIDAPTKETDIRTFLNKLCSTNTFSEYIVEYKYYYCYDEISKKIYDRLQNEPNLKGLVSIRPFLKLMTSTKYNLLYALGGFYDKYGHCYINFNRNFKTINNVSGVYISVSSTESDKDILKDAHVNRVKYILTLLGELGYEYTYECRTLSDTHIKTDEECEI